jgi:hypothetical protein
MFEILGIKIPCLADRGGVSIRVINAIHLLSARGVKTDQGGRPGLFERSSNI